MNEQAVVFPAAGEELLGILHHGAPGATRGVLVVVGGPQYRVGSHRQFVLLARHLAGAGVPVFRFDYRGMGDAGGAARDFSDVGADIAAAIDAFQQHCPDLREVVLWGLCDAASAGLAHAWRDPRVSGLALLNPWVRTDEGLARAQLRGYYLQRLFSRDLWSGLVRGRIHPVRSLGALLETLATALARGDRHETAEPATNAPPGHGTDPLRSLPLPERMAAGWRRFDGPILLILSGDDLTAAEFRDTARRMPAWRGLLEDARVTIRELDAANHTFSRAEWRDRVADWTLEWVAETARG